MSRAVMLPHQSDVGSVRRSPAPCARSGLFFRPGGLYSGCGVRATKRRGRAPPRHRVRFLRLPLHLSLERYALVGLRSEEHTSELQSPYDLVCRLLLEKKKKKKKYSCK